MDNNKLQTTILERVNPHDWKLDFKVEFRGANDLYLLDQFTYATRMDACKRARELRQQYPDLFE